MCRCIVQVRVLRQEPALLAAVRAAATADVLLSLARAAADRGYARPRGAGVHRRQVAAVRDQELASRVVSPPESSLLSRRSCERGRERSPLTNFRRSGHQPGGGQGPAIAAGDAAWRPFGAFQPKEIMKSAISETPALSHTARAFVRQSVCAGDGLPPPPQAEYHAGS